MSGSDLFSGTPHFRRRSQGEEQEATTLELFFDLVFVFAITQLSHPLLEHLTGQGAAQTALPAARRVVGVDLHDVDDQLVRPRRGRRAAVLMARCSPAC